MNSGTTKPAALGRVRPTSFSGRLGAETGSGPSGTSAHVAMRKDIRRGWRGIIGGVVVRQINESCY